MATTVYDDDLPKGNGTLSSADLKQEEEKANTPTNSESQDDSPEGGFYKPGQKSGSNNILGFVRRNRFKLLGGGAAVGGIFGVGIFVFLSLIPLKIENIVNSLQTRFFSTSENAMENETQSL